MGIGMILEEILQEAVKAGASDVHITVGIPPKMRVNGSLSTMNFPRVVAKDTLEIMLGTMNEKQRGRFEESGEYDMSLSVPGGGRSRIHMYKQKGCVALAVRIIDQRAAAPELLGLPENVMDLCEKKSGLILATGPAGCGVTTTLAAMVDRINHCREAHIVTLEKPIEYLHQHRLSMIDQREIGVDCETYAAGLRAAEREDADVIVIGELREPEAVAAAVNAAGTGRLVLASMHALNAADAIACMIDMLPQHAQKQMRRRLSQVLEAVISQYLEPSVNGRRRLAQFQVDHVDDALRRLIRGE